MPMRMHSMGSWDSNQLVPRVGLPPCSREALTIPSGLPGGTIHDDWNAYSLDPAAMLPQTYTIPMQDEEFFEQSHAVDWVDSPPVQVSSTGLFIQHNGARWIQPASNANITNSPGPHVMAEGRRCSESSTGDSDRKVEMPTTSSPRRSQNGHATKNDATSSVCYSHGYESLVRWRREGKSYKQIKELGGFTEAESTLRGKFRTLTKSKKERPRRPEWTQRDIHLLNEAVAVLTGCPSSLRCTGKSSKIPWKKVAEYIAGKGGYRFGNATCKKKWVGLHGDR
ncbi:hypothetical protein LTR16_004149 [Cryomyces antarcticus]|uniref:Myb-like domain-containing protein n=1 Tax=Cryomyces antarcticus TaxID=329879 RepID=A0ABR0LPP1_9PEZI|nr:hypothetical protein LTR39_003487 [Cryomyces antarcticus]KAK5014297.1 hypothetical protein LTR60_003427 [Cryomyces antarcticus]KAK5201009.1 hypothetical protein LTR16_004149 [Cryomyces antarcticus]